MADAHVLNTTFASAGAVSFQSLNTTDERLSGWLDQPNYRGTYDIVWTCLVTVFICTYTCLCLNVPAPKDTSSTVLFRRMMWMGLAILGPEFVLTFAAGQWSRARQSVAAFHASGHSEWSMRQAFFADMGGYVLHAKDAQPFPLNAKQLHWLVTHKFVDYPTLTDEEIWDKSKQDRIAKVITAFQIGYVVLQCIGRAAQRLAITTLELNTLAIVVCSLMTVTAWYHKPQDIRTPTPVYSERGIHDIAGSTPWHQTPLDFIDDNSPGWSVNVQPFMKLPWIPAERPIQRIPNDRFPTNPYGVQEYCLCFATLVFTAVHVAGWQFSFPTVLEQILWRAASMLLFGITAAFWILETIASWFRLGRWKRLYLRAFDPEKLEQLETQEERKLTQEYEPVVLPVPWEFWSITPLAVLYGVARAYLIVEAFLELRSLEGTAFLNVDWSAYLPHVGLS